MINKNDVNELVNFLTHVCQLLDGWHSDISWTEWDENVRKQASKLLIKYNQCSDYKNR